MGRTHSFVAIVVVLVGIAFAPSFAQTASPPPQGAMPAAALPMDPAKLRRHIYVLEGALARAVSLGAQDLNRKLRSAMPDVMAPLSGEPQARGVYLDDYGVYFDVAVPVLNQVMISSVGRMLGPDDTVITGLSHLKSYVQSEKNAATRASLEAWLGQIELQLAPFGTRVAGQDLFGPVGRPTPGISSAAVVPNTPGGASQAPTPPDTKIDRRQLYDPNAINRMYTDSVQTALIDTIIDYVGPLTLKPGEFLTIAARDNMQRDTLAPLDPYEEVVTFLWRFKGSDLAAYRAGQIDAAELRKRIEIREF